MSFIVYKNIGETTADLSTRIKNQYGFKKVVICGKLDPMARGMVRILADDHTKLMKYNLHHSKTYKFYLVLNIKTDIDDIMGLINSVNDESYKIETVKTYLNSLLYTTEQKFHPYSAIKVRKDGQRLSLHQWAKQGLLTNDMIPSKKVTVDKIYVGDHFTIQLGEYISMIQPRLETINNGYKKAFRVDEIIKGWASLLNNDSTKSPTTVHILPLRMSVSSGYYIRMISYDLYHSLNINSHIYDIHRIYT